jgi:competence protein ComGF
MTNLKELQNKRQELTQINAQIFELQSGLNLEPIRELQQFSSNNSTLESIRDELLITLNDADINQFLTTFA